MSPPSPPSDGPDRQLGPYTILQELGRGGQGVVYLARDLFGQRVAIKAINALPGSDADAMERLRSEGEFLALLNHPNIARVFAPLVHEGSLYIVLEYVAGQALSERLRHGPMDRADALHVCRQIALAIEAAHLAHVVHRDLKPSNVRLTPEGAVKVVDFGVACYAPEHPARPAEPDSGSTATRAGELVGTYGFMAPEQMMRAPTDHRVDVWAFGCILFQCLVGEPLYPGRTFDELFLHVACREAPLSRLPADTPRRLRAVLKQCLVRNPAERLGSISEVVAVLDALLRRSAAPAERAAPRTSLPRQLTSFIGREHEIAEISSLIRTSPVVCITGPGGSGKTRLAIETGRRLARSFRDGVWFLDVSDRNPDLPLEPAIREAIPRDVFVRLRRRAGGAAAPTDADSLAESLADARLLLVIDQCDLLKSTFARAMLGLLSRCGGVRILATSRERLELAGHQAFALAPLPLPPARLPGLPASRLLLSDSVRMFLDRARMVDRTFAPDDDDLVAVAELCRRLEGLPLAIELAAARVGSMRPADMVTRLDSVLGSPPATTWDRRPHHWTIDACIRWSYELLTPLERHILARLSVFRGGWTLDAAESICSGGEPDVPRADVHLLLTRLVNKSLIGYQTQSGRYSMLESVKAFADRALDADQRRAIAALHFDYFASLAQRTEAQISGAEQVTGLRAVQADIENLMWSLDAEVSGVEPRRRLAVAVNLSRFWYLRGFFREGCRHLDQALARAGVVPPPLLMRTMNALGLLYFGLQDYPAAERCYRTGLQIALDHADKRQAARMWDNVASMLAEQERLDEAEVAYRAAMAANQELSDTAGTMRVMLNYGYHLIRRRMYDMANAVFRECLASFRTSGDRKREANALHNLGEVAYFRGEHAEARPYFIDSLRIKDELGDRRGMSLTLYMYGLVQHREGAHERAASLLAKALEIREELGVIELPMPRAEHEAVVADLSASLGPDRFQAAWDRGHDLYDEEAVHTVTAMRTPPP